MTVHVLYKTDISRKSLAYVCEIFLVSMIVTLLIHNFRSYIRHIEVNLFAFVNFLNVKNQIYIRISL